MGLSGQQREKLQDALINAFPDKASLEQMLSFQLNEKLDVIASGTNLREVIFNLIKKVEAENRVKNLIDAAYKSNPGNLYLKAIAKAYEVIDFNSRYEQEDGNAMADSKLPQLCNTKTEGGNHNERFEKSSVQVDIVNIHKQNACDFASTATQKVIGEKQLTFVLTGTISDIDKAKLRAIQAHLRKISGDAELTIIDVEEGSIKIKLNGSPEGLNKLEELFKSGKLTEVLGIPVESVQLVPSNTQKEEKSLKSDNKINDALNIKKRTYIVQNNNTVIVLAPVGRLDITTAWQFRLNLQKYISKHSPHIIVNLGQVNFIDSSGLTSLVAGMRDADKFKGTFRICNIHSEAKLVFEVTMMDGVFEIFDTEEEALADLSFPIKS